MTFKLLTVEELMSLPPPTWLLQDLLIAGSFAVLYGPPGIGKSFLALDFALSIATNIRGIAEPKMCGSVVYVAAEGSGGLSNRVAVWESVQRCKAANIHFLPESVNFLVLESVNKLIEAVRSLPEPPHLIVIDTLARCMTGDENSAQDVGQFIAMIDRVRRTFKCAVLIVHHSGKGRKKEERGSSALRGAADTMLCLCGTGTGNNRHFTCEKQKDAAPFALRLLRLEPIDLGNGKASCVIRSVSGGPDTSTNPTLKDDQKAIIEFLSDGIELTHTELKERFTEATGRSPSTFNRVLRQMECESLIEKTDSGKYVLTEVSGVKPVSPECHDTG